MPGGASHAVPVAQQFSQSVPSSRFSSRGLGNSCVTARKNGQVYLAGSWLSARVRMFACITWTLLVLSNCWRFSCRPKMPYLCGPQTSRRAGGRGLCNWNPMESLARLEWVAFLERLVGMEDPIPASPSTFSLKLVSQGHTAGHISEFEDGKSESVTMCPVFSMFIHDQS